MPSMTRVFVLLASVLLWSAQAGAGEANARIKATFLNPGKVGEVFWDLVSDTTRAAARQLYADVEILYSGRSLLFANWNATEAETLADRYLQWAQRSGIRPGGVWAANDPIALGAIKAIEKNALVPGRDIGVVGLNWSPEALAEVKAGRMILTDGGHFFGGGWAMVMLRDLANGCDFARGGAARVFPLASIDRSNLPEVEGLISGRRFDRVRFGAFLAQPQGKCGHYDFSLDALLRASRPLVAN
jgi:hypothetical protein